MAFIGQTFNQAIQLLWPPAGPVGAILGTSFLLLAVTLVIALLIGIPLGALLALKLFPCKTQAKALVGIGIAFPPILTGLAVSLLFWPGQGPLGHWQWLHTPVTLVLTYVLMVLPIIVGFTMAGLRQIDPQLLLQFQALGASSRQLLRLVLWETRLTLAGALLISSARILSEVGAAWVVGGHLPGSTAVLATAIATETMEGNPATALALGLALLGCTVVLSLLLSIGQKRRNMHEYSS